MYAEIGLSLGRYLIDRYQPGLEGSIVDVADLIVEKALIPHCNGPQMLRTSADVDWASKSAKLVFRSHNVSPTFPGALAVSTVLFYFPVAFML